MPLFYSNKTKTRQFCGIYLDNFFLRIKKAQNLSWNCFEGQKIILLLHQTKHRIINTNLHANGYRLEMINSKNMNQIDMD